MNTGNQLTRIECQLQEQADRLLILHGHDPPTAALVAAHRRRRRRRIVRCSCGVAALLMLMVVGGVVSGPWRAEPVADQREGDGDGRPVVQNRDLAHDRSPIVIPTDVAPGHGPVDRAPQFVAHAAYDSDGPPAWPVLITVPEGDKQRVIATGFYVPEHTRPLNLLDLTPAQQHAVRQVLGIPQDSIFRDPI